MISCVAVKAQAFPSDSVLLADTNYLSSDDTSATIDSPEVKIKRRLIRYSKDSIDANSM